MNYISLFVFGILRTYFSKSSILKWLQIYMCFIDPKYRKILCFYFFLVRVVS